MQYEEDRSFIVERVQFECDFTEGRTLPRPRTIFSTRDEIRETDNIQDELNARDALPMERRWEVARAFNYAAGQGAETFHVQLTTEICRAQILTVTYVFLSTKLLLRLK